MGAKVDILRCKECGAPVALGDGDHVKCPFCAADVAIPAEQRDLRDAVRADAAARTRAAELYAEVGTPPSLFLRVFTVVTPLTLTLVGVPVLAVGSLVLYQTTASALGRALFHVEILDVYSETTGFLASMALGFAVALLLLVLGAYGHRRGVSLREVQAGLAMRPPEREGGPATCRVCGAPLTIPNDADGVMCDYCRADNLVRVPEGWIAKARSGTKKLASAIEEATDAFRAEVEGLRKRLRARLLGWSAIAVFFFGLSAFGFSTAKEPWATLKDWPPSFRADVHGEGDRPMHAHRTTVRGVDVAVHHDKPIAPRCDAAHLDRMMGAYASKEACDEGGCSFRWIVALRHGERLTVASDDVEGPLHFYQHIPSGSFDDSGFKPLQKLQLGAPVTFVAPISAWYAVGVRIGGLTPKHARSLCFTLAPGG
jgi:uncharacterized Zn finger protein (UPF0148 family)